MLNAAKKRRAAKGTAVTASGGTTEESRATPKPKRKAKRGKVKLRDKLKAEIEQKAKAPTAEQKDSDGKDKEKDKDKDKDEATAASKPAELMAVRNQRVCEFKQINLATKTERTLFRYPPTRPDCTPAEVKKRREAKEKDVAKQVSTPFHSISPELYLVLLGRARSHHVSLTAFWDLSNRCSFRLPSAKIRVLPISR